MFIFDFDGVLIDSLDEVTLAAYNAETDTFATSLNQLEPDLIRLFKRNRFHVQPIGDALPLMSWCVDDSFNNLRDLDEHFRFQKKTMRLCLAVWGYLGPDDSEEGRKLQFSIFEQKDLISIFNQGQITRDKV
jgi:hypothetical protein